MRVPEEQGQEVEQGQTTQAPDQHQNAAQQVLAQLGEESEDDEEGEEQTNKRKRDDEEFLDDRGVSKEEREEARRELDLQAAPQAEEGEEEEAGPEEHEEETGSRKKKKKKGKKSEEELRMEVETMVARMQVAADRDTKAHRSGKPGMNKLHLLPEVSYMLRRHDLQSLLVDPSLGVLDAIRRWISPLDTVRIHPPHCSSCISSSVHVLRAGRASEFKGARGAAGLPREAPGRLGRRNSEGAAEADRFGKACSLLRQPSRRNA